MEGINMNKSKFFVFDFDGCFYKTPTTDIPKLEDAIDVAMLRLFIDKLEKSDNKIEVLSNLDKIFDTLDKSSITPNLHNQNSNNLSPSENYFDKGLNFSEYIANITKNGNKTNVSLARALAKMMEPNGAGNHRVSGMLNLNLDISQKDIENYYKKYATIKYHNIKRNNLLEYIIAQAKLADAKLFIYTDNSKNNVISGMKTLGYNPDDFEMIIDMFDCNGGETKKMQSGIDAFKKIIKQYCKENNFEYNLKNLQFYDDNKKICENMSSNGIQSFHVQSDAINKIEMPIDLKNIGNTKGR